MTNFVNGRTLLSSEGAMSSAGTHIQQRRKAMGISQSALAAQIGVDKSYLCLVESGKRVPTEEQIANLSSILGLPAELLLLQAGRLPKDVQGAIETDATAVTAAVRVWAEQDAIDYPTRPAVAPSSNPRQKRVAGNWAAIPPLIHVSNDRRGGGACRAACNPQRSLDRCGAPGVESYSRL
ncbi:MAG: helix-turn-helix domain-containing protein [Sphingomonadaceae bacterium]